MKKIFLLLILGIVTFSCKTEIKNNISTEKSTVVENFPESWVGSYQGDLHLYSVDSIGMNLPMALDITKINDSVYQWKTTYKPKGREADIRDYELKVIDTKKGHYMVDEKNSIKIDAFYRNKTLTTFFEVMDSYIVLTETKIDNGILFEITSATGKKKTVSGNTIHNGEDISEVTSYFVNGKQKAILCKVSK